MSMPLEDWIDPRHLTEAAIADASHRFAADPHESMWFDDFLLDYRIADLRLLWDRDGEFVPWHGDYGADVPGHPGLADSEVELAFSAPRSGHEMRTGYLTLLMFAHFLNGAAFRAYMERISGVALAALLGTQIRIAPPGHFVRPHTDHVGNRKLCLVLYPGPDWRPQDGGRLRQMRRGERERTLDPLPNRLVAFRVSERSLHAVDPVSPTATPRRGLTIWMGDPAEGG